MTARQLQQAKTVGRPVILKANPPRTYVDAAYRVKDIVMRKIKGKLQPVAVLEDFNGRSLVYAEPRHIVDEEQAHEVQNI